MNQLQRRWEGSKKKYRQYLSNVHGANIDLLEHLQKMLSRMKTHQNMLTQ